jgi:hypothetical protein
VKELKISELSSPYVACEEKDTPNGQHISNYAKNIAAVGRERKVDSCFKNEYFMGHGQLDSIPGSKPIPGIDISPHKPSKNIDLGHRPAEINRLYVTLSGDNAISMPWPQRDHSSLCKGSVNSKAEAFHGVSPE